MRVSGRFLEVRSSSKRVTVAAVASCGATTPFGHVISFDCRF
jgi:hypothetical protein